MEAYSLSILVLRQTDMENQMEKKNEKKNGSWGLGLYGVVKDLCNVEA